MRGKIISAEYQKIVFVRDDKGGEYACYVEDLQNPKRISENEKENCLNTGEVMGSSW